MANQDLRFRVLASVIGGQAIDGLKRSVDGVGRSADGLKGKFSGLERGIQGLVAGITVGAFVQFSKSLIDAGDELFNLSQKTGIAVRELSGLQAAAQKADVPIDALSSSLTKFSRNLADAQGGNRQLAGAFNALGISITDANGQLRPSGDLIKQIADRFSQLQDGPQKAALAVRLFGKSGADLIPVLNEGSAAISRLGLAIDDDFAARADAFNDSLTEAGIGLKNLFISGISEALPALQETLNSFNGSNQGLEDIKTVFVTLGEVVRLTTQIFDGFVTVFIQGVDAIFFSARSVLGSVIEQFQKTGAALSAVGQQIAAFVTGDSERIAQINVEYAKRYQEIEKDSYAKRLENWQSFADRLGKRQDEFVDRSSKRLENSIVVGALAGRSVEDTLKAQREATAPEAKTPRGAPAPSLPDEGNQSKIERERDAIEKFKQSQQGAIELRKLELESVTLSTLEREKLIESRKLELEAEKASIGFSEENRKAYLEAAEAIKEQKLALMDLEQQQRETWSVGAQQALNDYLDKARDVASQTRDLFNRAFGNMEDSIVDFVKTGKLNFRKLADDIITDLIRIQVRALIVRTLTGITGGFFGGGATAAASNAPINVGNLAANGGVMTQFGMTPLKKYAAGGVANSPQLAIFGEGSKPEAYVPLPDGRTIPVTVDAKGGGQKAGDVFNITVNYMDGQGAQAQGQSDDGRQLGILITSAVQSEIIKQKRPGGLLAT